MPVEKITIWYAPSKCIGAGECVKNNPAVFGFDDRTKKAMLIGGKINDKKEFTREITGDSTHIGYAITAAASCPVNAFIVKDSAGIVRVGNKIEIAEAKELHPVYDDAKDFVLDPKGYFLIRVNAQKKEIEVGFCNTKNIVVLKVIGKKPIDIYTAVARKEPCLRPEHYAYLGRELEKAYHCIQTGLVYVQDGELHEMKLVGKKE
ncbi:MAG: ferredoxin [Candidatus Diapherotrites archaeon]